MAAVLAFKGVGAASQDLAFGTGAEVVVDLQEGNATNKVDDKEFVEFVTFAPDGVTSKILSVKMGPVDGTFDYPGGSYDAGERPTDPLALINVTDDVGNSLATLTFAAASTITLAQLEAVTSLAELEALLLGGDDQIFWGNADDIIRTLAGNDLVFARGGRDTLYGGTGNDGLNGEAGNDRLYGDTGHDRLFGGAGNDREDGGTGNDLVHGGDGNDILIGGAGNDKLIGGFGRDTLTGGSGRDTFAFQTLSKFNGKESGLGASKRDTITDFKHGQDKIDPSFILVQKFKFLGDDPLTGLGQIHYKYVGANTLVEISTDRDAAAELQIFLKGHITLTKGDFIL